jgi:hypothetical protein
VYADAGLLTAIHTGNAQLLNGTFTAGLPQGTGPGLQSVDTRAILSGVMGSLSSLFSVPQPAGQ